MNQNSSLFEDKKISSAKPEFKPFVRKRGCIRKDIFHFDHPSCCNENEYVAWRTNFMTTLHDLKAIMLQFESAYMQPLLKYDQENPVPSFEPNHSTGDGDHIDAYFCCSLTKMSEYIDWFEKTQLPFGFKHQDFWSYPSKEWPYMKNSKRYNQNPPDQEMTCSVSSCNHCTIL